MANMHFPPVQYKIEGRTDFDIEGKDTRYNLENAIILKLLNKVGRYFIDSFFHLKQVTVLT